MIEQEGKYYVYRHIRLDKNEVFYVGIGTIEKPHLNSTHNNRYRRAYNIKSRTQYWKKIVAKTEYRVDIIIESNSYDFIKDKEMEFIKLYGRKDLGEGTLVNFSNGGEGIQNRIFTKEHRENMSKGRKGKHSGKEHYLYGKTRSDELKQKLSEIRKGLPAKNKGVKMTPEQHEAHCIVMRNKTKKYNQRKYHYIQRTLEGNFIKEFLTKKEIIEEGFEYSAVCKCSRGEINHHFNFKWERVLIEKYDN